MYPVPDPLLLRKSGSAGDRTRDLCICSQKLWPLDHRGGSVQYYMLKMITFVDAWEHSVCMWGYCMKLLLLHTHYWIFVSGFYFLNHSFYKLPSLCVWSLLFFFSLWRCGPAQAMASPFTRFLDHTQRRTTVGRTPLDEWSPRRRDLYLTTHNTYNRQASMPPVGFEPTISAGEQPQEVCCYLVQI